MNRPETPVRRAAFTLVELLVVMAIISTLAGILLPALTRARIQARSVACRSNLRQLYLATAMYCADNDGFYPPASWDIYSTNLHRWHGTRHSPGEPFDFRKSPLRPYLVDGRIKTCPAFARYNKGFEKGCGGYGYNGDYIGSSWGVANDGSKTPAKESLIHDPSKTLLYADCAFLDGPNGHLIEYSFITAPVYEYWGGIDSTPSIHFRHAGRANVVWADGHATSEPMGFSANRPWYPGFDFIGHNIGYVGPFHDNRLYDRK